MFTQNCYFRKNTKDLQEKLEKLGYSIYKCCNNEESIWLNNYISNSDNRYEIHGIGFSGEEIDFMGYNTVEKHIKFFLDENEKSKNKSIDCGTNEDLFIALSSFQENTDKNQWFVLDTKQGWPDSNGKMIYKDKGTFELCLTDSRYPNEFKGSEKLCSSVIPAHKATVEELIEHFK